MNRRKFLTDMAQISLAAGFSVTFGCRKTATENEAFFPILDVAGSARELGEQHGQTFKAQIAHNLDFYLHWLSDEGKVSKSALLDIAGPFGEVLKQHQPDLFEEIQGIATGSGFSLEEILLINARTDMRVMVRNRLPESIAQPGCTALAIRGQSPSGSPLMALGQNWDWNVKMKEAPIILRLHPDGEPSLITLTEAGMVGKIGFNQYGLGVCLNFLSHDDENEQSTYGVPVHCLLRAVMGCKTIAEAIDLVAQSPRCASANFLVAQHHGETIDAVDLEWTPHKVQSLPMHDGFLVHTNHFKHERLQPGCKNAGGPSTTYRDMVATHLAQSLAGETPDPASRMQRVLESRHNLPFCISRSPMAGTPSATLAGIVMDLSQNRLFLTQGAPHRGTWTEIEGVTKNRTSNIEHPTLNIE